MLGRVDVVELDDLDGGDVRLNVDVCEYNSNFVRFDIIVES